MKHILPLLLLPLLACSTQNTTEEVQSITSSLSVQTGSLERTCAFSDVCSDNPGTLIYNYEVDNLNVNLFFEPAVASDKTEEAFNEYLKYMSFELSFPHLDSDDGVRRERHSAIVGYEPTRDVALTYDGTSVGFTLRGSFDALHVDIDDHSDPACDIGDVLGECTDVILLDASIAYEIAFTLEVPQE